jgi:hypothetical protein
VLALVSASGGKGFSADHLETARALAALATITIANVRRHLSLRRSFLRSLQAMARAIDDKVPYMQGHSARVARVCELVAARLDVEPEVADDLVQGALLHEIGKIYVPDHVLLKSGQLTPDEYTILKQYPVIGYEICEPLGLGDDILMLIRNHAERLDGTGYPDGLKFGELPLPLRILSAADAFDAMSSYRLPQGHGQPRAQRGAEPLRRDAVRPRGRGNAEGAAQRRRAGRAVPGPLADRRRGAGGKRRGLAARGLVQPPERCCAWQTRSRAAPGTDGPAASGAARINTARSMRRGSTRRGTRAGNNGTNPASYRPRTLWEMH